MGKVGLGSSITTRIVFGARFRVLVEHGERDRRAWEVGRFNVDTNIRNLELVKRWGIVIRPI